MSTSRIPKRLVAPKKPVYVDEDKVADEVEEVEAVKEETEDVTPRDEWGREFKFKSKVELEAPIQAEKEQIQTLEAEEVEYNTRLNKVREAIAESQARIDQIEQCSPDYKKYSPPLINEVNHHSHNIDVKQRPHERKLAEELGAIRESLSRSKRRLRCMQEYQKIL